MKKGRFHIAAVCMAMVMFILAVSSGCKAADTNIKAEDTVAVTVNGKTVNSDVAPVIKDEHTLVPVRAVFEAMGADVSWDDDTSTAICTLNGTEVRITVGEKEFLVNGESRELEVPAEIIDGRTMIPVRAVSEALNCNVDWDGNTRTVIISTDGSGAETNAEAGGGTKTANMSRIAGAYYDFLDGMVNEYGSVGQDDIGAEGITGVVSAEFIDFDANGVPEMYVITQLENRYEYRENIYAYVDGQVKSVLENYTASEEHSQGDLGDIIIKTEGEKKYVCFYDGLIQDWELDDYTVVMKEFNGREFVDACKDECKFYLGTYEELVDMGYDPGVINDPIIEELYNEYYVELHTVTQNGSTEMHYSKGDTERSYYLEGQLRITELLGVPGYFDDVRITAEEALNTLALMRDSSSLDYAAAYKTELESLVDTYGIDRYEDRYWLYGEGLVNVKLVDFNADGTPEMFVYYNDDGNCVRVYTYKNGRAEVVYELSDRDSEDELCVNIHDYGNEKLLCYEYSNRYYMSRINPHETHSTSHAMRFNGNDFEELCSIKEIYGLAETKDDIADLDGVTNEDLKHLHSFSGYDDEELLGLGKITITENGTTKVYYSEYYDRLTGEPLPEDIPRDELINMLESVDWASFTGIHGDHNTEDYPINVDIVLDKLNTLSNV